MKQLRLVAIILAAVGCGGTTEGEAVAQQPQATQNTARAVMRNAQGQELGVVTFTQTPNGLLIRGDLNGLPPGVHGFHFHETGRCEPDFDAAGGHYNPTGSPHGFLVDDGPHAGDLPNLHVMNDGRASFEVLNTILTIQGGNAPLLDQDGSALIIHTDADDYRSQPTGNAGGRFACGVVQG